MSKDSSRLQLTLFAEASPARTSVPVTTEQRASLASARASGESTRASSRRSARASSSSKTSPPVPDVGCPTCGATCTCWGTEPVPSRFLPQTSERPTSGDASSLLPTLTASEMQKWAGHRRLLPTLTAQSYGSNKGGAAGRVGPERKSLDTLAREGLLPTLTSTIDHQGWKHRGKSNLKEELNSRHGLAGGSLSPTWCEWFMGFPEGWTEPGEKP